MTDEDKRARFAPFERAIEAVAAGCSPCCDAALVVRESAATRVSHCAACGAWVERACRVSEAP